MVSLTLALAQPAAVRLPGAAARTASFWPTTLLSGALVIAVALTAVSLGGSSSATGSAPGAGPGSAVPPTQLSLTSRLVALEVDDANVELFHAHSTYPTYWQVAVLNVLRNGVWVAGPTPAGSSTGSAAPAAPAATFSATVEVAHLSTKLLPVPPNTDAVIGLPTESATGEGVRVGQRHDVGPALHDGVRRAGQPTRPCWPERGRSPRTPRRWCGPKWRSRRSRHPSSSWRVVSPLPR